MAQANLTAAIIGLYFYPKCSEAENNWTVTQRTDTKEYKIRMRMWNPNYKSVANGRLLVSEPLNKETKWPTALGKERIVGGKTESIDKLGFLLPDVFKEMRGTKAYPMEPSRLICATDDNARLAPFFGSEKPKGTIGAQSKDFKQLCLRLSTAWGHLVHQPDSDKEGAYFGFNIAKAHWLYPHYVLNAAEIDSAGVRITGRHKTTAETYNGDPMQPWPTFRLGPEARAREIIGQQVVKFYELFNMPNLEALTDAIYLQFIKLISHLLVKTFIFKASDLISFVRNLIDILILSF